MPDAISVVWFKRDLRLHDHAALIEAARHGRVLPLYIVEPTLWQLPDSSRRHWHFIHDCLTELSHALQACGTTLVVRVGEVTDVLASLRAEVGQFTLFSHEETGNGWTFARDKAVAAWCRAAGIAWHELPTNGVVRRLDSRDGWSAIRDARMRQPVLEAPAHLSPVAHVSLHAIPAKDDAMFGPNSIGTVQAGGRSEGLKTLSSFLDQRSKRYMQTISKPGVSARHCSRLSAHLAFGSLSVREVEHATYATLRALKGSDDVAATSHRRNLSAFLSRLAWRCHFVQKLEQQPSIEYACMHPAFEGMREPHHNEAFFAAWMHGHTGYPLIDACMRSLHENGWITFRMRALLVSFASYHLWLDWRKTAPVLAQLFTDYEPGIHYSQFQMQSGVTGINAVRMYNPIKQSLDHDPQGVFIRRFVPELRAVPDAFIHEPWRMENLPADYPAPIVDHASAIKHARTQLGQRFRQEGFSAQAKAVNQKLGSRNRPSAGRRASLRASKQAKVSAQLSLEL